MELIGASLICCHYYYHRHRTNHINNVLQNRALAAAVNSSINPIIAVKNLLGTLPSTLHMYSSSLVRQSKTLLIFHATFWIYKRLWTFHFCVHFQYGRHKTPALIKLKCIVWFHASLIKWFLSFMTKQYSKCLFPELWWWLSAVCNFSVHKGSDCS